MAAVSLSDVLGEAINEFEVVGLLEGVRDIDGASVDEALGGEVGEYDVELVAVVDADALNDWEVLGVLEDAALGDRLAVGVAVGKPPDGEHICICNGPVAFDETTSDVLNADNANEAYKAEVPPRLADSPMNEQTASPHIRIAMRPSLEAPDAMTGTSLSSASDVNE